jgi:hypothetical protein
METTKHLIHWGAHAIRMVPNDDPENAKVFTLTVSPVTSGKADDTVQQLQDQFKDLEKMASNMNLDFDENTYSITRISNRMSDRAANERKVTNLLQDSTKLALQEKGHLSQQEILEQSKIHSFTCAAHKINNMAIAMTDRSAKFLYEETISVRGIQGAKKHIYECNKLLCEQSRKEY